MHIKLCIYVCTFIIIIQIIFSHYWNERPRLSVLVIILPLLTGGYAFVYVAQDVKTGTEYALKRLIGADQQACHAINNEINVHRQLSGHGNVVTFVGSNCIAKWCGKCLLTSISNALGWFAYHTTELKCVNARFLWMISPKRLHLFG